jgi:citrate lyase subunit beta/citryl-CoA lyase
MLFVPGDAERKLAKVADSPADALILDLEDSVALSRAGIARGMILEYLKSHPDRSKRQLWVRISPLETAKALEDLTAILPGAPDGIVMPKADSAADAVRLDHCLEALEVREGVARGSTKILGVATETAHTLFTLHSYVGATPRLYGLTWGAEDLSAALGAFTNQKPEGGYDDVYRLARSLCLAASKAAEVEPVGSVYPNFRDLEGLAAEARYDRQGGFTGKIAIHPDQVQPINDAFTPSAEEVAHARRVVALFAENPDAGTLGLDGKMLDKPHLTQAEQILAAAARAVAGD